ncbi:MAG: hypothetical protein WCK02_06265 [Bacteroidota bacterium]
MKKLKLFAITLSFLALYTSCRKDEQPTSTDDAKKYTSIGQFYAEFAPKLQTHTINASTGGTFTTSQGTVVNIPANAFKTQSGSAVTGNVTIEFKDIYKKSDMLLANVPTTAYWGAPIKSGGEFFIKAIQGSQALVMAAGKKIEVIQPILNGMAADTGMLPMVIINDSTGMGGWAVTGADTVVFSATSYIFNLYEFNNPVDSGSWCNSDNPNYFNNYQQTTLTMKPTDSPSIYHTDVFLVFKNINCMVHVYNYQNEFPYYYAPIGLECTVVALGVKDGKLYSSFVPITISANQIVNFTLTETTATDFTNKLNTLN